MIDTKLTIQGVINARTVNATAIEAITTRALQVVQPQQPFLDGVDIVDTEEIDDYWRGNRYKILLKKERDK